MMFIYLYIVLRLPLNVVEYHHLPLYCSASVSSSSECWPRTPRCSPRCSLSARPPPSPSLPPSLPEKEFFLIVFVLNFLFSFYNSPSARPPPSPPSPPSLPDKEFFFPLFILISIHPPQSLPYIILYYIISTRPPPSPSPPPS